MDTTADRKELFESRPVPSALWAMIIPAIISQIIVLIYNMADTFYIGRTNNPYMVAGASLVLPVFNMCLCISGLAGIGGGTLISRLLGNHQEKEAKAVSCFSFYLSILLAFLFSLTIALFMKPILSLLGAGEQTYRYASQYAFCVLVLGGIPTVLSNVMSNLVRSVGLSKEASFGITLGGVLNIVLDPLFMFVILPAGYEVLGVGIATFLSNCMACCYFFVVIHRMRGSSVITFHWRAGMPSRAHILSVFAVGIPSAVATLLFDLDYVVIDKLMVSYSDIALAAIGIVLKIERLPLNVGIGICQGMVPLIAYNFASGNHRRMDAFTRLSLKIGVIIAAASILLYELFAAGLVRFFISEAQTVELATQFLRIRVLATPLMFMSFFTVYVFQAFGKGNISLFLGVVRWMVFNIPMLFLLDALFGIYGIVWSQIIADVLTVLLSLYVYRKQRRLIGEGAPAV